MEADYQNVDNPSGQLLAQKAKNAVYSGDSGAEQMFEQLVGIFSSAFGLFCYSKRCYSLGRTGAADCRYCGLFCESVFFKMAIQEQA